MQWNVGSKISAGFGFALLMLIIIGVISLRSTFTLTRTAKEIAHKYAIIGGLNNLLSNLKDAETGQRGFIITGRANYLEPYLNALDRTKQNISVLKELMQHSPKEQEKLGVIETLINKKFDELEETIQLRKNEAKGFEAAQNVILTDKGKIIMDQIRQSMKELEHQELTLLQQQTTKADESAKKEIITIILGTIITLISLFLIAFFLTRNIAEPLKQLSIIAEKISAGDLNVDLDISKRSDEVGILTKTFLHMTKSLKKMADVATQIASKDLTVKVQPQSSKDILGNAFVKMIESLRIITKELAKGINILDSSTNEIVSSTNQFTINTSEIAAAVNETTVAFEEMRQTTHVFNQKAKVVSEEAEKAKQISQNGIKSAANVALGMERIKQQTDAIFTSMKILSGQGQSIKEIIDTVEDLAAQSNLLSVNAAIQASKAGEHGAGFIVVAQEMKRLSEQSQQATKQVRGILNDIQNAIHDAVAATGEGTKVINEGVLHTEIAGKAIQALAENVIESAEAATLIETSTEQQLLSVEQMATAMNNIKEAINQNASSAKDLEISGINLSELGSQIKCVVNSFKV